ncbi:MAG: hypothetical protein IJA65_03775, partial [Acholeplasmatales bacterium]|nr:hypothetical protein [Acholeplasmatales bacterium]
MTKQEWTDLISELKLEYKKTGKLCKESRKTLENAKKEAIEEGYITSQDLNEIAKMSIKVSK